MIPEIQERISKLESGLIQLAQEKAELQRDLEQLRQQLSVARAPEANVAGQCGAGPLGNPLSAPFSRSW